VTRQQLWINHAPGFGLSPVLNKKSHFVCGLCRIKMCGRTGCEKWAPATSILWCYAVVSWVVPDVSKMWRFYLWGPVSKPSSRAQPTNNTQLVDVRKPVRPFLHTRCIPGLWRGHLVITGKTALMLRTFQAWPQNLVFILWTWATNDSVSFGAGSRWTSISAIAVTPF
jgi:hypothetical protein